QSAQLSPAETTVVYVRAEVASSKGAVERAGEAQKAVSNAPLPSIASIPPNRLCRNSQVARYVYSGQRPYISCCTAARVQRIMLEADDAIARHEEAAAEKAAVLLASRTCEEAQGNGHLEVLQWARNKGCPWSRYDCRYAAQGHDDVPAWISTVYANTETQDSATA
ncbi:unnamed protein product, partial [Ectocarpus sp. 6 AP-2014]